MAISRNVAQAMSTITSLVRTELGDLDVDAAGNAIPAAGRRFSDTTIFSRINFALVELGTKMAIQHSGDALVWTDLAYSEDTGNTGDVLPTAINAEGVVMVYDVSDVNIPIEIFWMNPHEISQVPVRDPYNVIIGRRYYTLTADPTTNDYRIMIRPEASGRTFRIWWIATPFITGLTTDAPLLSERWVELIAVMSAMRLLSINGEVPEPILLRAQSLMADFTAFSRRQKHPERVRMLRRFY